VSDDNKAPERVAFSRGYGVCIMGIDGTWRRDCMLNAISDTDAILTVEGSIQGLNLKEFFLLLSSTGLAYRRCELVRVNGTEIDVQFLKGKNKKKKRAQLRGKTRSSAAECCPPVDRLRGCRVSLSALNDSRSRAPRSIHGTVKASRPFPVVVPSPN